jgi:bifunctional non-homologous end joining protein LigD
MTDEARLLTQLPVASDAVVRSVEWVFEPYWHGERLLARVHDGKVLLTDAHGAPPSDDLSEAATVLGRALIDGGAAVIDGVWTTLPFPGDGGSQPDAVADSRPIFVAVDLLELDGQPLLDVPYLERRRLLGSLLEESARVRISPAVRMPVLAWLAAWRAAGFEHYVAKHMNSRYRPGERAKDWLKLRTEPMNAPTALERLFGRRPKSVVHVEDDDPSPPRR